MEGQVVVEDGAFLLVLVYHEPRCSCLRRNSYIEISILSPTNREGKVTNYSHSGSDI